MELSARLVLLLPMLLELCFAGQMRKAETKKVDTTIGTIFGIVKNVDVFGQQKRIITYFGIPYAEPPIGILRFNRSIPKRPLEEPLYARKHGPACLQMNVMPFRELPVSEDCLFLNMYVPADKNSSLPVMVFIHGGGFVSGASDYYVPYSLAGYGDVIVVTFNYRLSALGFLSTEDEFAPGNYALWDQHLAIKWVSDHIRDFGGDPYRVTLVGSSTGAVTALAQSVYEGNKGLFKRLILQSGSTEARPFNFNFANPWEDALHLGSLLDCKDLNSELLIKCLRKVPFEQIRVTLNQYSNGFVRFPFPFILNRADGEFLKESLTDILHDDGYISIDGRSNFASLDILSGFNTNDGCSVVMSLVDVPDLESKPLRSYQEYVLIPNILEMAFGSSVPQLIKDLVFQFYTNWTDPDDVVNLRNQLINLCTDLFFAESQVETTQLHEKLAGDNGGKSFLYAFDVLPPAHFLPSQPSWCAGPSTGDELFYLFYEKRGGMWSFMPHVRDHLADWDIAVAKNIMAMWTNFANSG